MKNYHELGFAKTQTKVDEIVDQELSQLDSEIVQNYPHLENFMRNLGSLCAAEGYAFRQKEIQEIL